MSQTLHFANKIGENKLLDSITKKLIEKESFLGHIYFRHIFLPLHH